MRLPVMNDKAIMRPSVMTAFGGINHNLNCGDGELFDMLNLSSRNYPLLCPRKPRGTAGSIPSPQGIGAYDEMWWVSGTKFYYAGEEKGTVTETRKQFAVMGSIIVIFPDKKYYDIEADAFGSLGISQSFAGVAFQNGTYTGLPANANTLYKAGASWQFAVGDAVTISGCVTHIENNRTVVVREVEGDYLRFYENTFQLDETQKYTAGEAGLETGTYYFYIGDDIWHFELETAMTEGDTLTWNGTGLDAEIGGTSSTIAVVSGEEGDVIEFSVIPVDYTESGTITLAREVPDLDFICVNENRLWGCKGDAIYASALGNPFNFNVFDGLATDSWMSNTVDSGDFTGCISYSGYPMFFKPESIYKVQGDKPSNYQWTVTTALGVKPGCERSIAVSGEALFYLSRAGICAYTGWYPTVISDTLGSETKWEDAAAGSDSIRYYVSMKDESGYSLFVYDTRYGAWWKEDGTRAVGFAFWNESLYYATAEGALICADGDDGSQESLVRWEAEFGDSVRFYETSDQNSQNKKGLLRFQLRCELDAGSSLKVLVRYDDEEEWNEVGTITGPAKKQSYNLPLILRRCDYYRLKLSGVGAAVVYSLTEVRYSGSNLQGGAVTLPKG